MANWKKVIVSGSAAQLSQLSVDTDVNITGSLVAANTVKLTGLGSSNQANIISIDTATGQLYYQGTGSFTANSASYAQTEMYFIQHCDYLMPRVHQMRTDIAQYYHSNKPSSRLSYMTTADEKVNFEINGTDLLLRDLNIFCSTTANHRAVLEQLKAMALNNNTTGASIYDLGRVVQSDSIAQLNTVLKDSEAKQQQFKEQELQQQQQMQQEQLQKQQEIEKMKLDAISAEKEKDRQRDLLVAEIRAAGYGSMADVNQNQQSDFADQMSEIRKSDEFQSQMSLQNQKESNRLTLDRDKNNIEREKLQTQKDIAATQLQIAKENKNKYDVAKKNKENEKKTKK